MSNRRGMRGADRTATELFGGICRVGNCLLWTKLYLYFPIFGKWVLCGWRSTPPKKLLTQLMSSSRMVKLRDYAKINLFPFIPCICRITLRTHWVQLWLWHTSWDTILAWTTTPPSGAADAGWLWIGGDASWLLRQGENKHFTTVN